MKKIVDVLVSFAVVVLIGVGNVFAQDKTSKTSIPEPSLSSEWKFLGRDSDGSTAYINTRKITYLPKGIVKVWTLWVQRGEYRRGLVNALKKDFISEGEDPNYAERLWYYIELDKVNCKTHQYAMLEDIIYSFGREVLDDVLFQHEDWHDIPPGSVGERIEEYVCNEAPPSILPPHKPTIPEPSLSSEWELVAIGSGGTTIYFNTRKITYLPGGIVEVPTLLVPRGEIRRKVVNILKKDLLSEGKNPNNAKRLWYAISLHKVNCKTHQFAVPEGTAYSFGQAVLAHISTQHEKWDRILPGSVQEEIERYVCKSTGGEK